MAERRPFNLEEALAGKPVVTRDGDAVTGLHRFHDAPNGVWGAIHGNVNRWFVDGRMFLDCTHPHDLFMAPVEREVWVNLYDVPNPQSPKCGSFCVHFPTEMEADKYASGPRLGGKAHRITWSE